MKARNAWLWIGIMTIITYLEKYFIERPVEWDGRLFVGYEAIGYVGILVFFSAIFTFIVFIFSKKGERKWDYRLFTIIVAIVWLLAGIGNYMNGYQGW